MLRDLGADLRRSSVAPLTAARYVTASSYCMQFCTIMDLVLGANPSEERLDEALADFIQWLWSSDSPNYWISLSFAACLDRYPRFSLAVCRRFLKA